MRKKIAFLLILFMVGSWCVFAEETEDDGTMAVVWILVGIGVVLTIVVLAIGGTADDVNKIWFGEGKGVGNPTPTAMDNSILNHGVMKFSDDKLFVGAKFSW